MSNTAPVLPIFPARPEPAEGHFLCKHLPLIAAAPGGIKKLRELILELAVRGKLVAQDPSDEPASELLERIEAEKVRLAAEKKIKRHKPLPLITNGEKLFTPPNGWHWIRFGDFANQIATGPFGSMLHKSDYVKGGVPVINPTHMIGGEIVPDRRTTVPAAKAEELDGYRLGEGDIVIARRGEVGRAALVREEAAGWLCGTGSFVLRLHQDVGRSFVIMMLRTLWVRAYLAGESVGTTMANLNHGILKRMPILVPPRAEQYRIVAKVDELMALCDRLEAQQADTEAAHATLVKTLLDTLTQSQSAADFAANWQRLSAHFDTLFTAETSIDTLKQTLLQLAVMGKLVPQDLNDEPARMLLDRCQAKKMRLIAAKRSRKGKELPVFNESKTPFPAPPGWLWTRLDDVAAITGGVTLGRKLAGRNVVLAPYLRVANVQRGYLDLDQVKDVAIPEEEVDKYRLRRGDLLITEGGDWDKVGRTAIWRDEVPDCLHQNHVFRARKLNDHLEERWAEMYLNSMVAQEYFQSSSKQTTNLASINMTQLRSCTFPLPPAEEQRRIAAKVDEMIALCDHLKAQLADSRTVHERLADALAVQVTAT